MAYHIKSKKSDVKLDYLPYKTTLKDGTNVSLVIYTDEHESQVHEILRHIVNVEGEALFKQLLIETKRNRKHLCYMYRYIESISTLTLCLK